jgi:hypothetical protein
MKVDERSFLSHFIPFFFLTTSFSSLELRVNEKCPLMQLHVELDVLFLDAGDVCVSLYCLLRLHGTRVVSVLEGLSLLVVAEPRTSCSYCLRIQNIPL